MDALVVIEAHGKVRTWSRLAAALGLSARVLATGGHLRRYPDTLESLGFRLTAEGEAVDHLRLPRLEAETAIRAALAALPPAAELLIATDDDAEGHVIAHDVLEAIRAAAPERLDRVRRLLPRALTAREAARALAAARAEAAPLAAIEGRAVQGRARALSDRWIGAVFSRRARAGCGRVRAAVLGTSLAWRHAPEVVRGRPETGEILFLAPAADGGAPFFARLPLEGPPDPAAADLAARFAGAFAPGAVVPLRSIGAAVTPRFGPAAPHDTGEALCAAARLHGIPARAAMRGLQDAYMNGRISYPRTDGRHLSPESCAAVIRAARLCGMADVDPEAVERLRPTAEAESRHEGLHPTPEPTPEAMAALRRVVRRPFRAVDPEDRAEVEDLMCALVARRAFEALRPARLQPGAWRPEGAATTREQAALLADLDWFRETGPQPPWARGRLTGLRLWPAESVLIEAMMIEGLGRPSTWAGHAEAAIASGQVEDPGGGEPPRPSPEGRRVLRALPRLLMHPAACRGIEAALSTAEDGGGSIARRMRRRIDGWVEAMPVEVRRPLMDALLEEGGGGSGAAPPGEGVVFEAAAVAPG